SRALTPWALMSVYRSTGVPSVVLPNGCLATVTVFFSAAKAGASRQARKPTPRASQVTRSTNGAIVSFLRGTQSRNASAVTRSLAEDGRKGKGSGRLPGLEQDAKVLPIRGPVQGHGQLVGALEGITHELPVAWIVLQPRRKGDGDFRRVQLKGEVFQRQI